MNKIAGKGELGQYVTMRIGHQIFGVSVSSVRDILAPQKVNPIPLARKEVIGSLNLRGRIITALDIRVLLNIHDSLDISKNMCVVIEHDQELYSLLVDSIGDVVSVFSEDLKKNPDNLSEVWQDISIGIYPQEDRLIVILDIAKILNSLKE